jgi:hypothetical protein
VRPTIAAASFAPRCRAAFETASQIDFTDFVEGDDHLLLRGIHCRHLVIRGHCRLFMCETSEPDFPKKMRLVELTIAVLRGLGILCGDFRAEVCAANHIDQQAPSRGVCLESDVLGTTNLTVEMAGSQKPILSLSSFRSSKSPICPTARSLRNPSLDTATSVECSAESQIHGYLLACW